MRVLKGIARLGRASARVGEWKGRIPHHKQEHHVISIKWSRQDHLQAVSNKLHLHWLGSPTSTGSTTSNRLYEVWTSSTSIDLTGTSCDHCKGHHHHHQGIKQSILCINWTMGSTIKCMAPHNCCCHQVQGTSIKLVGINDNLQQQSPPLSLMTTTHAPPKSMLPSKSLSPFGLNGKGWYQLLMIWSYASPNQYTKIYSYICHCTALSTNLLNTILPWSVNFLLSKITVQPSTDLLN